MLCVLEPLGVQTNKVLEIPALIRSDCIDWGLMNWDNKEG